MDANEHAAPTPSWHNDLGGVVYGTAVQAQSIHGGVRLVLPALPPMPPPSQLPPAPAHLIGRSHELTELNRLAREPDGTRRLAIVVIVGAGGLGKTALAASWLHGISDQFEGGALFADLRGHLLDTAARPGDVAASFLRAFGIAPGHIPVELGERAALFRTVTTGRRVIVLLDNAASAAQVRMLLPGPGPEPGPSTGPSLVVVTTRWRIAGLAVDGAKFLDLSPLDESASLRLFDRIVGTERAAAEPEDRRTVVRLSGGMPLALSVTAARLAAHPHWPVSRVAADLADDRRRLAALSLTDDLSVRAAFDTSYRTLSPAAARAYRMSALIPGPDFGADLAAAVLDDDEGHVRSLLETLADASLLTETNPDRYRYHDLARLHARERADSEPAAERHAATARAVAWYLDRAVAADLVVSPLRWHLNPMYEQAAMEQPAYADSTDALDWLEAQLPGLLATVQAAHDADLHKQAWQLCEALWGVFLFGKHFQHWISSHLIGLASAQACDDPRAEARMRVQLGTAFRNLSRAREARQEFITALSLDRRAGHPVGEATALEQIALVDMSHRHLDAAIHGFTQAQAIHQRAGVPRGVAMTTRHIGEAHREAERYTDALRFLAKARRLFAALPDPYMEARTLTSLAQTYLLARRPHDAVGPLTGALTIMTRLGSRYEQARIERYLGVAAIQLGDLPTARHHVRLAIAGFEQAGAPEAEEVRHQLATLGEEGGIGPAPGLGHSKR